MEDLIGQLVGLCMLALRSSDPRLLNMQIFLRRTSHLQLTNDADGPPLRAAIAERSELTLSRTS